MQIKDLFDRDIARPINGVVKADQLDDDSVWQELDEFVITRELDQHLRKFVGWYLEGVDQKAGSPAGKMGVWISGFFGSGKSHFLKVLSYLLRNRTHTHAGRDRAAVEFFRAKVPDAMFFADVQRAVAADADVVLFNIDSKASHRGGRDAILQVFLKVLNEMQGFSGDHPHIAHMERHLEGRGKLQAFRDAFAKATGSNWDSERDAYEFNRACESLYHFAWDEFCDWYLELAKVQLAGGHHHTTAVLAAVLDVLLKLLHPVMPFVTETLWKSLTGAESLVVASWPTPSGVETDHGSVQRIGDLQRLVTEIRRFRSDQGLADRQKVAARVSGIDAAGLGEHVASLTSLAWLTKSDEGFSPTAHIEVRLSAGTVNVELDTSGTVDVEAERRRLEKDLAAAKKELAGTAAKLANDAFLAKAPADVVATIRGREQLAREEVDRISARLAALA